MTLTKEIGPDDVCPDDQPDPSLPEYKPMYVERTLTIARGLKPLKKQRKWLYYRATDEDLQLSDTEMEAKMREKFGQPDSPVTHHQDEWAIWSGEGQPDKPAFDLEEKPLGESWYYSSLHLTEDEIRKAYRTLPDAPVEKHPAGILITAVWGGVGAPTRKAFPDELRAHSLKKVTLRGVILEAASKVAGRAFKFLQDKLEKND